MTRPRLTCPVNPGPIVTRPFVCRLRNVPVVALRNLAWSGISLPGVSLPGIPWSGFPALALVAPSGFRPVTYALAWSLRTLRPLATFLSSRAIVAWLGLLLLSRQAGILNGYFILRFGQAVFGGWGRQFGCIRIAPDAMACPLAVVAFGLAGCRLSVRSGCFCGRFSVGCRSGSGRGIGRSRPGFPTAPGRFGNRGAFGRFSAVRPGGFGHDGLLIQDLINQFFFLVFAGVANAEFIGNGPKLRQELQV